MIPRLDEALDRMFALATKHGLDVDFHVDETGDPEAVSLRRIAEAALRNRFEGRILCGHCCSLAMQEPDQALSTLDLVAEAGIAVVTLPMCNLYLQDRVPGRTPRWRGVTLLHEMRARGIPVAVASDNCRDPFYGYGDHDMVEVYREATRILHLDRPFGDWPRAATATPAAIMGLDEPVSSASGRVADLVVFRARGYSELLSRPQSDRVSSRRTAARTPRCRTTASWTGCSSKARASGQGCRFTRLPQAGTSAYARAAEAGRRSPAGFPDRRRTTRSPGGGRSFRHAATPSRLLPAVPVRAGR